jgi:hypothetical protein
MSDEEDMTDRNILVCYRVADLDPHVESRVEDCDRCTSNVWVALSSPQADLIFCHQCAFEVFGPTPEPHKKVRITVEQVTDIMRYHRNKLNLARRKLN